MDQRRNVVLAHDYTQKSKELIIGHETERIPLNGYLNSNKVSFNLASSESTQVN